jgi:hypothetical protein
MANSQVLILRLQPEQPMRETVDSRPVIPVRSSIRAFSKLSNTSAARTL